MSTVDRVELVDDYRMPSKSLLPCLGVDIVLESAQPESLRTDDTLVVDICTDEATVVTAPAAFERPARAADYESARLSDLRDLCKKHELRV